MSPTRQTEADLLALERQVCFALAVTNRSVLALYRPILEPLGLTHPQYLVMLTLWDSSPRTISEISTTLQLEMATLSPLLKRMASADLVNRTRSTTDERTVLVTLTAAGRRLRNKALKVPPTVIDRLGMNIADLEDMRDSLLRLNSAARDAVRD
jgi:MarR family transcriptional regulator, organic hydroperoxide resistance regulator